MQTANLTVVRKPSSLSRVGFRPGENETLRRANDTSLGFLGHGDEVSSDPKGRLLRQLRLNQDIDPSSLATHACISLNQLYAVEMGDDRVFYTSQLRELAARKVASLLGVDWDKIQKNDASFNFSKNVINLNRIQLKHELISKNNAQTAMPARMGEQVSKDSVAVKPLPMTNGDKPLTHPVGYVLSTPSFEQPMATELCQGMDEHAEPKTSLGPSFFNYLWVILVVGGLALSSMAVSDGKALLVVLYSAIQWLVVTL